MLIVVQSSSSQPFVDGVMEARSACNEDAVLDRWDSTQMATFSGPDDVQCKDVYGYTDCDPPLGMPTYGGAHCIVNIAGFTHRRCHV